MLLLSSFMQMSLRENIYERCKRIHVTCRKLCRKARKTIFCQTVIVKAQLDGSNKLVEVYYIVLWFC